MLSSLSSTIITVFGISHLLESPLMSHDARQDARHDFGQVAPIHYGSANRERKAWKAA
jgi:hypothetical protein